MALQPRNKTSVLRRGTESSQTRRWREVDSNHRSPLPRLSSIRAVRAEIIERSTGVFRSDREFDVSALQGRLRTCLANSVVDRPGADRWNLASTTFPDAGPMVRIWFPPAMSHVRTRLPTKEARRSQL